jgi:hypothetical protein
VKIVRACLGLSALSRRAAFSDTIERWWAVFARLPKYPARRKPRLPLNKLQHHSSFSGAFTHSTVDTLRCLFDFTCSFISHIHSDLHADPILPPVEFELASFAPLAPIGNLTPSGFKRFLSSPITPLSFKHDYPASVFSSWSDSRAGRNFLARAAHLLLA